jgi:flavodoxin
MGNAKILVVFYSRSGFTRVVAQDLARVLNADLEELVDTKHRGGVLGYLRSSLDAALKRLTTLKPLMKEAGTYDIVLVGTPIWNASMSSPVRTFLTRYNAGLRKVAFFCTYGGSGNERVFRQMTDLCGKAPLGAMAVRDREIGGPIQGTRIREFVDALHLAAAPG